MKYDQDAVDRRQLAAPVARPLNQCSTTRLRRVFGCRSLMSNGINDKELIKSCNRNKYPACYFRALRSRSS
jgi:hypothetical protein